MKKSTKIQSIISIILIVAVIVFGVIAYLTAQRNISSKLKIVVSDKNVNVQLFGEAQWASGENSEFETNTSSSGFQKDTWDLPNVEWTDFNADQIAVLKLTVNNLNVNDAYKLKFNISGIQYDRDLRFQTTASHQIADFELGRQTISDSSKDYSFEVPSTTNSVTIFVEYKLLKVNTAINVDQDITMSIKQEPIA